MRLTKLTIIKFWLKTIKRSLILESINWRKSNYSPPSPQHVKVRILKSNSIQNATWIETGTYLGDTTLKLAKIAYRVISIEPQEELSQFASMRLKRHKNVQVVNEASESCIAKVLENVSGPVCFWLDGHYSGDITFQGVEVSPITSELATIADFINENKSSVVVFIDDFRLFVNSRVTGYPDHLNLVRWAQENEMLWTVEHDIFVARNTN